MAGYNGYSMSNNAVAAYADGEKPLSKWTKSEILESISEISELDFSKLRLKELRDFLTRTSWHSSAVL